ncbi:hypothetical protein FQA39_LY01870 [Lamprigera yunnana]|nr:hypothetical protein FQA39_LY01870 [Lamprigera yunnana]
MFITIIEANHMCHEVIKGLLSVTEVSPTKVLEVKANSYTDSDIHSSENGIILYKNVGVLTEKPMAKYEVILTSPNLYSLFRTEDIGEAELKYDCLKNKVPIFLEVANDFNNISGIQKICDVLIKNPTWNVAHLAAFFAVHNCFSNSTVEEYLNCPDETTGISPLQVAVKINNLKTVQMLIAADCSLEHVDHNSNSVFHYAATISKELISVLSKGSFSTRVLNIRNSDGYTPLHLACLADKRECVTALLLTGANVNITATPISHDDELPCLVGDFLQNYRKRLDFNDMKYGGTPLHWTCSRSVVDTLIDRNCNVNAVNFQQRTALHVMVLRNRLECVLALLCRKANPNLPDFEGNTPLHLAVKEGNIPIMQSLIIFEANFDFINHNGESPRHVVTKEQEPTLLYYLHAVGALRCSTDVLNCTDGCSFGGTYNGSPPKTVVGPTNRDALNQILAVITTNGAQKTDKLLCLDGGGIRGLILVQMLLELEKELGFDIKSCFDWIAGTSTGGILALTIATGKTLKECLSLYFRLKESTFVGMRPYCSETFENLLKETFGSDTTMADIKHPKLLITGCVADRKPLELCLFRNYQSPADILNIQRDSSNELPSPPQEQLLWRVARATGAAPTYFRALGCFLDGGIIANNPTLDALTEIHEYNAVLKQSGRENEVRPLGIVVSLGTGRVPVTQLQDIDVFKPESIWDATRVVAGISSIATLLVDQVTASDGRVTDRARAWCSMIGVPYFRFSPQMSEEILMDETSDVKLCNTLWEAKAYMHSNIKDIKEINKIIRSNLYCNLNGIQRICDVLADHSSWTLAHLAAHFSLHDCFNNAKISGFLNSSDEATGMSPLQVGIQSNNFKTVQMLLAAKCSLEHLDYEANSVFHYAATTTKEIISVLCQGSSSPRCLNSRNHNGHTPLHLACLADKCECVKALLLAGADVNITAAAGSIDQDRSAPGYVGDFLQNHPKSLSQQDMKFGGTPLHWSCSRSVIDILVDKNCSINAINFEQRTALHVMVLRNRLECVVALLCRNADPDLVDFEGNTPLHLAVQKNYIPIIQCLTIFGANLDLLNNNGHSPRHLITKEQEPKLLYYLHAVGAKRCPSGTSDCTDGCRFDGTFDGIPPTPVIGPTNRDALNDILAVAGRDSCTKHTEYRRNKGKLLCLDGGGIRGLVLIQMLLELESELGVPINNCFDWIAGTSTGGILALGIAAGKTMKECLSLYFRMKELTFVGMRPYSSEALENVLKETFGPDTVMTDIKNAKVLITGCLADRKPLELHLFRNYKSPSDILNIEHNSPYELPCPPDEQLIWHVGRATGAAPTYFRAFGRFLDGGLIANNPTLDALTEIHEYNLALKAVGRGNEVHPLSIAVSLGTGLIPVTQVKCTDVFRPESFLDTTRLFMGISSLGALLVDQATASDGRVVDRARAWCSMIGVPYFRFSPQMYEEISMDEKSDEKLCKMLWEVKSYMHTNAPTVKEVADIIRPM